MNVRPLITLAFILVMPPAVWLGVTNQDTGTPEAKFSPEPKQDAAFQRLADLQYVIYGNTKKQSDPARDVVVTPEWLTTTDILDKLKSAGFTAFTWLDPNARDFSWDSPTMVAMAAIAERCKAANVEFRPGVALHSVMHARYGYGADSARPRSHHMAKHWLNWDGSWDALQSTLTAVAARTGAKVVYLDCEYTDVPQQPPTGKLRRMLDGLPFTVQVYGVSAIKGDTGFRLSKLWHDQDGLQVMAIESYTAGWERLPGRDMAAVKRLHPTGSLYRISDHAGRDGIGVDEFKRLALEFDGPAALFGGDRKLVMERHAQVDPV